MIQADASWRLDKQGIHSYTQQAMTVSATATINVSSLLVHDVSEYEAHAEGQLIPDAKLLEVVGLHLKEALQWQVIVRSTGGDDDFILEGSVSGKAWMDCRRCLEAAEVDLAASFIYPMVYKPGQTELMLEQVPDEEDRLVFGKPLIDLTELLTQLTAIELPLTALCREDCKGLSPEGINLNEHPEVQAAPDSMPNSPFGKLKDWDV